MEPESVVVESSGDMDLTSPLDRPTQAGVFTSALTRAVQDKKVDAAVHSLKDLPLEPPPGIVLAAVLERDDPADVLLVRDAVHDPSHPFGLTAGARVGTSSPRRQTQALQTGLDLVPVDVRGNIHRRLALLENGVLDALFMAKAALDRLRLAPPKGIHVHRVDPVLFPPAPGQATIAIQARQASPAARILSRLDDPVTRQAVTLERDVLWGLGGGCGMPLGAHAWHQQSEWHLAATLASEDWRAQARPLLRSIRIKNGDRDALVIETLRELKTPTFPHTPTQHTPRTRIQHTPRTSRTPKTPASIQNPTHRPYLPPVKHTTKTLVATMDESSAARHAAILEETGWNVVPWPLVETTPTGTHSLALELDPDPSIFWVAVTSARAVPFIKQAVEQPDGSWRSFRVAAIGPSTVIALRQAALPVHVVSKHGTGADLAHQIGSFPADPAPVLWPAAAEPAGGLAESLSGLGFKVHHWPVYRTRARRPAPPIPVEPPVHALLVTSPSNAQALKDTGAKTTIARTWIAIGPTTARAMQEAGYPVDHTLPRPSPHALASLLQKESKVPGNGSDLNRVGTTAPSTTSSTSPSKDPSQDQPVQETRPWKRTR